MSEQTKQIEEQKIETLVRYRCVATGRVVLERDVEQRTFTVPGCTYGPEDIPTFRAALADAEKFDRESRKEVPS